MPLIDQFAITDCGSIVLFQPLTDEARGWWDDHVNPDAQWLGSACAVERRFAGDILDGIQAEG